ncbi:LysR family transcriptional regulator [Mycobacteroides abscessus]|nr:LysR family transcriptional regulator [Mycobacteroides abscessus]MDM2427111.1 LysR family transcriptional regulator [Mycobacteroides abscessus]MDM2432222.1 LysR family transcriptional regulator [Mycobacteroides abscessus]MDM2436739.1 LysR family transcriptional regulator [Mycobacteroides abscessus]MDM2438651.1 LysR family transcriptional regulator [Mycobacteroides abscessus]
MRDNFDLNLLRVFDALVETGSVSEAAGRLHLSVPATSRALGRLRRAMDDPILTRAGRSMVPTPFALRSAGRVRALIEGASGLLEDTPDSQPATWRRSFAIRINDGLSAVLAPRLIALTAREAPGVRLRFIADDTDHPNALRDGSVDLDIGVAEPVAPDIKVHDLCTDRYVALVSGRSQLGRAEHLTVEQLCHHPHIVTAAYTRDQVALDGKLNEIGRSRHIVAEVPTYAVAALMALEGDMIAVVPGLLAQHLLDRQAPVRWPEVPLDLPNVTIHLRWHRRFDDDHQSRWLRRHVALCVPSRDGARSPDEGSNAP